MVQAIAIITLQQPFVCELNGITEFLSKVVLTNASDSRILGVGKVIEILEDPADVSPAEKNLPQGYAQDHNKDKLNFELLMHYFDYQKNSELHMDTQSEG